MADIKDQLIKDSYNYVLQSDLSTGIVYRIGGAIPVNPIFSSGLTVNSGFTYSNGTEQPGYALLTDGTGYAYWAPVSASTPSSGVTSITVGNGLSANSSTGAVRIVFTGSTGITGDYLPLSGGTVTGGTIFQNGVTANTISATTYFNLPVSGLTSGSGIGLVNNNGNYTISYTGSTGITGDYLPLSGGTVTGGTIFQSGLTSNTISATSISATTYYGLPVDVFVTGGTYSNGTLYLTNNTGHTFNIPGFSTATGNTNNYYGSFSDTTTQVVNGANTPTAWSANTTEISNGIYIVDGSKITVSNDGIYEIGYSAQIEKTQGVGANVTIWAKINGNNVERSSSTISLENNSVYSLPFVSYIFDLYAGDQVEFYFSSPSDHIQITTLSGLITPTRPVSPSLIIVAKAIGNAVLNNSGDTYVSGFTLTNNKLILSQNRLGQYSGFTVNLPYLNISGGTITGNLSVTGSTSSGTISATTYQNLPSQSGTGVSSLSYTSTNGILTLTKNDLTTLTAGTFTYLTGASYSNNIVTLNNNLGSSSTFTINTVTGFTINGGLTVTGNTSLQGLTATTISATTYQNLPFSGTVTGGGTTNYVPKWTGSTELGNSQIFDNGTNVGIGTISPSAKLDINASIGGTIGVRISGDSSSDMLRITQTGSGNAILVEDSSNPDSTPFVVTSGGTIGVGITTPDSLLHVHNGSAGSVSPIGGTTMTIENNSTNYLSLLSSDSNLSGIVFGSPSDSFGSFIRWGHTSGKLEISTANSNDYIQFGVENAVTKAYVTNTGFGVNTLPSEALDISGNSIIRGTLTATTISATTYQNLPFSGTVTGGGTTNYVPKWTGSTGLGNSQIFDNGTNVGIGTSSPSARLDVSGDTLLRSGVTLSNLSSSANTRFIVSDSNGVLSYRTDVLTGTTITITGGTNIQIVGSYPNFGVNFTGTTGSNFTGGTVTGATNFTNGLTANTFSATTYFNLPVSGLTSGTNIGLTNNNGNYTISFTGGTILKYYTSGSTPTGTINDGDRWFNSTDGVELVYITDTNGSQWIQPNNGGTNSGSTSISGNYLPISGGTVTGNTVFQSGLTANTLTTFNSGFTHNNSIGVDRYSGEVVKFGGGSTNASRLYYYNSSGNWVETDSNSTSTSTGMLGIGISDNYTTSSTPTTSGILVRGFAKLYYGGWTTGDKLYVADDNVGIITNTAPTTSGYVVRIVGYVVDGATNLIYFCPDNTWVQLV